MKGGAAATDGNALGWAGGVGPDTISNIISDNDEGSGPEIIDLETTVTIRSVRFISTCLRGVITKILVYIHFWLLLGVT